MSDDIDTLMQTPLLRPPTHFTRNVMRAVRGMEATKLPEPVRLSEWRRRWGATQHIATAIGLTGSALLGLSQLVSFVFGLWMASAAI